MKTRLIPLFLAFGALLISGCESSPQQNAWVSEDEPGSIAASTRPLYVADIRNATEIIGEMGIPLGKVCIFEGTVVSGDSLGTKAESGSYLLRMEKVERTPLKNRILMRFSYAPGAEGKLAANHFELSETVRGEKVGSLTSTDIERLEKGYVGERFIVMAYENGGFDGIPRGMPPQHLWQDSTHSFRTYLVLLEAVPANFTVAAPSAETLANLETLKMTDDRADWRVGTIGKSPDDLKYPRLRLAAGGKTVSIITLAAPRDEGALILGGGALYLFDESTHKCIGSIGFR